MSERNNAEIYACDLRAAVKATKCRCGHPCLAHAWEDVPSNVSAPCDLCDCNEFDDSSESPESGITQSSNQPSDGHSFGHSDQKAS